MNKENFFCQTHKSFSPSLHWEHCLWLEEELLKIIDVVPLFSSMPKENFEISSPKIVNIFANTCFLLEAAMKNISNEPTDRIINYLKENKFNWCKFFLEGKNREGKSKPLDICDFLTFYEGYCSLTSLEARIRYSRKISDVWINNLLTAQPFYDMQIENSLVTKSPSWWNAYNQIKHNFYSYPKTINLEIALEALAGLLSFTAVVPQMRRLLCDHGYIQDNQRKSIGIHDFGRRENNCFKKDEWVGIKEMVLLGSENNDTMPAVACVSNLFIVQFKGDYRKYTMWSGLGKS